MNTGTFSQLMRRAAIPLIFLALCLLAFGLFAWSFGFYWDDWLVIFHTESGRTADLITLYAYDRPLAFWTALLSGSVLGVSPLAWQLFSILIRWLAALGMWWALRALWPGRARSLAWAALLFVLYPVYFLQPISVALNQHWIAYALFLFSLGAMGWAQRRPEKARLLTGLSLAAAFLHLITLEYFAGLELLRPVYLYLLFVDRKEETRPYPNEVLRTWRPYLLLWLLWGGWRLFLMELPVEPHPPQLLLEFVAAPLPTLLDFAELVLQSYVRVLWSAWAALISIDLIDFSDRFALFAWLIGGLAAAGLFVWVRPLLESEKRGGDALPAAGIPFGLLAIFLGLIPVWLVGEEPLMSGYNERFALPAMFGAALVWVGLIWRIIQRPRPRALLLSILLGLSVAANLRAAQGFREDWRTQRAFYEQLSWRAPSVEPGTVFMLFQPVSAWMPNPPPSSAAINTLYAQSQTPQRVDYWAFDLNRTQVVEGIETHTIFSENYRGMRFEAQDADSLLFLFVPENGCLWLLGPLDVENEYVPFENRGLAARANLSRIHAEGGGSASPNPVIFGDQAPVGWCYYYERAELARQSGQWYEAIRLLDEAESRGLGPNYGVEWLPFLEAYVRLADWPAARELSQRIHDKHVRNDAMLCATWAQLAAEEGFSGEGARLYEDVKDFAACDA